jgi:hypothetical protein
LDNKGLLDISNLVNDYTKYISQKEDESSLLEKTIIPLLKLLNDIETVSLFYNVGTKITQLEEFWKLCSETAKKAVGEREDFVGEWLKNDKTQNNSSKEQIKYIRDLLLEENMGPGKRNNILAILEKLISNKNNIGTLKSYLSRGRRDGDDNDSYYQFFIMNNIVLKTHLLAGEKEIINFEINKSIHQSITEDNLYLINEIINFISDDRYDQNHINKLISYFNFLKNIGVEIINLATWFEKVEKDNLTDYFMKIFFNLPNKQYYEEVFNRGVFNIHNHEGFTTKYPITLKEAYMLKNIFTESSTLTFNYVKTLSENGAIERLISLSELVKPSPPNSFEFSVLNLIRVIKEINGLTKDFIVNQYYTSIAKKSKKLTQKMSKALQKLAVVGKRKDEFLRIDDKN